RFAYPDTDGMTYRDRLTAVPDGTRVVERLERSIPVIDGVMCNAVSSDGINLVLVPSPEVMAVSRHEPVGKRGPAQNPTDRHAFRQLVPAVRHAVVQAGGM